MTRRSLAIAAVLMSTLLAPASSWANHAIVNCGPAGYWDNSISKANAPGYYVWLMNDDTVKINPTEGNNQWFELGTVKYGTGHEAISSIQLFRLKEGDAFEGPNFRMTLDQAFSRPKQKKDRRYFKASFKAKGKTGQPVGGKVECAFGLK